MKKNEKETFGTVLKRLRKKQGLSIKKLSSELDINYSYISKIENDHSLPSGDFIGKLAEIFDYDEEELMIRAGKIPDDILKILRDNPKEAVNYLREKFFEND